MRRLLAALLVLAGGLQGRAEEHGMPRRAAPVRLMAGLGDHRHPIATAEPEAQRFFDQGLNLVPGSSVEQPQFIVNRSGAGALLGRLSKIQNRLRNVATLS